MIANAMSIDPHLLLFQPLIATCQHGHEARRWYGSNTALCTCGGFEVAAKHRDEVEEAHNVHVKAAQRRQERVTLQQYQRDASLHELFFRGPDTASCKACQWMVHGMDSGRIREAFSNHLDSVRKALERKS